MSSRAIQRGWAIACAQPSDFVPPVNPPLSIAGLFGTVQNGAAYSGVIAISGGTPPITPTLVIDSEGGPLPPTLSLSVVGTNLTLSGTEI